TGDAVQARVAEDLRKGKPIVVHVVVALCDNKDQGIVPVPKAIGNGQNPTSNLYWGAGFGLRYFFTQRAGWALVQKDEAPSTGILERIMLRKVIQRGGREAPIYLVAEAWDGRAIKAATMRFLSMAAGEKAEVLNVQWKESPVRLQTAGAAHLLAYIGHDGLMDFTLAATPAMNPKAPPRSSVILACASKAYFQNALSNGGSHPLLLTTNLMAPEAYTLDAAVTTWAGGASSAKIREAAAAAYAKYQKISLRAARGLFTGEP
ncbi:MAG: hypothetical protein Q8O00_16200, partial [Holophaga sp.]|nr:hypothetical protein [Holophaga sp.]